MKFMRFQDKVVVITDDIARAVLFLASSDAAYVTGAELAVDGGLAQI